MGHDKIVGINIPRQMTSVGMLWVTRGVMFLKFRTHVDAETFMDRVHGISVMSGNSQGDHLRDLRVTWAHRDLDTYDNRGRLHPNRPRYFGNVWVFLPKHVQGLDKRVGNMSLDLQ